MRGQVSDHAGAPVERPVIVIRRNAQVYGWVNGHHGQYELSLPAGEYSLSATAQGMSQSTPAAVTVVAGAAATRVMMPAFKTSCSIQASTQPALTRNRAFARSQA